jgi:hypothetical protein
MLPERAFFRSFRRTFHLNGQCVGALWVGLLFLFCCIPVARAQNAGSDTMLGPHLGVNLDADDAFVGIEGRFDAAQVSPSVALQLNPSFSFYLVDHGALFDLAFNVPFEFALSGSSVRPYAAPGLSVFYHSGDNDSDTHLALNLIGGVGFALSSVYPFVQLRVLVGHGSSAEIMGGALFYL